MIAYVGIDAHTTNYTLSTYLEGSAASVNTNTYSPLLLTSSATARKPGKRLEMIQRSLLDMKLDAEAIARSLKNHEYSEVYTPDEEDESVRDFIRMQKNRKK